MSLISIVPLHLLSHVIYLMHSAKVKVENRESLNTECRNRSLKITGSIKLKQHKKKVPSCTLRSAVKILGKERRKICVWMFQYSHLRFRLPRHNSQFKFNQYFEMRELVRYLKWIRKFCEACFSVYCFGIELIKSFWIDGYVCVQVKFEMQFMLQQLINFESFESHKSEINLIFFLKFNLDNLLTVIEQDIYLIRLSRGKTTPIRIIWGRFEIRTLRKRGEKGKKR